MYFCPNCNYIFDISKASNETSNNDNRIPIKKIPDVFKKLENKEDLSNHKAESKQDDITKNAKYKKLTDEERMIINKLFEETSITGAEFRCNNCNYIESINETVLLYKYETDLNKINIKTLEENELLCKNPILPRTHDYICKNINCSTIKNKEEREAVFFREKNSYKINYICCICYNSW